MKELRRDPNAILTAHKMDPDRRELYVEGSTDRLFIKWLAGARLDTNALILEIACVDLPEITGGGERGRLLRFAEFVKEQPANIRFWTDADFDRLLGRDRGISRNVWLTDGHDLESYYLREDCFSKVVSLGIGTDTYSGSRFLSSISRECRVLGLVRLHSIMNNLDLPFQATNLHRHISFRTGNFSVDIRAYVTALVSNASLSISVVENILNRVDELSKQLTHVPDADIIHGKDLLVLVGKALQVHRIDRDSASAILRTSFESPLCNEYRLLSQVVAYVCP